MRTASLIKTALVTVLSGLFLLSCKEQEPEAWSCDLTVQVTDASSKPVAGAVVTVDRDQKQTDQDGKCVFPGLKKQRISVTVSADYYQPFSQQVNLAGREDSPLIIRLTDNPPYLRVDTEQIDTKVRGATATLQIESNTEWRVESASEALSFSPTEGKGNGTVHVYWDFPKEQDAEDLVSAEFSILSRAAPITIPVLYHLPIRLTGTEVTVPNLAVHSKAPAVVRASFSRKVRPVRTWLYSLTELDMHVVDDYTVSIDIPYNMVELGADRILDHVVVESAQGDGVTFDETVVVPLYDGKVSLEGCFRHWTFGEDESTLWVCTDLPKRIYQLDARTFEVRKSFDVNWLPEKIAYNRYNGRLYVVGDGVLKVLDAETGAVLKVISKNTDSLDHPQFPCNTISNVLLADNGFGIIITTNERGTFRWFYLDSRNDDRVEHTPLEEEFGNSFEEYTFYDALLDHSRSKIIGRYFYSNVLRVVDSRDKSLSSFAVRLDANTPEEEYAGGNILDQKTHREKDLMLHCYPYSMVVQDYVNDTYTPAFVNYEFRSSANDFCYGDLFGDDLCTYSVLWKEGRMTIYNHSTHSVQYGTYTAAGAYQMDLITFLEGDRIVFLTTDGNGASYFTTINTSRFFEE